MTAPANFAVRHPRLTTLAWLAASLVIVTIGYAIVAGRNSGFFLVDDIESSEFPMMSHLGSQLREGVWPWITERNWTLGLVAGDPQYGIFNPITLLTYWAVDPIDSLLWRLFLIVLFYVCVITAAAFWAARALGATAPYAALAAVTAGLNLCVLYWYAAGWTSLLPGLAWFVVAVAALLAALDRPDRPWRAVVAGLTAVLVFTAGSPFALLAYPLTVLIIVVAWLRTDRWRRLRELRLLTVSLLGGALLGAVPWIVAMAYLDYTRRISALETRGFLTLHLEALAMSFSPSARPFTVTFQGFKHLDQPAAYVSWLMAGAVAVLFTRRIRLPAACVGLGIAGVALFAATIGPELLGPYRWPFRITPFATVVLGIVTAVVVGLADRFPPRQNPAPRWVFVVIGASLTMLSFMTNPGIVAPLVTAIVLFVGVPFVLWGVRQGRRTLVATVGVLSTFGIFAVVVLANPETTDLIDLNGPATVSAAREDLEPLSGHRTLQLLQSIPDGNIRDVLANNYSLYGSEPAEVINGYSSLVPEELGGLLCLSDNGYACLEAPAKLFSVEPQTGLPYIDLLGVSQVMVQRGAMLDAFEQARSEEWTVSDEGPWWVMYRNGTALGESPVVWASDGARVDPAGSTDRVSLPAGGRIALSRPLWPGTTVSVGGVEADLEPVGDVFVGARFEQAVSGELRIGHELPGRRTSVVIGTAGAVVLVGCAVAAVTVSRRARRSTNSSG